MQQHHHIIAAELIREFCNSGRGVEVGVHRGRTAYEILQNTKTKKLFMVDTWLLDKPADFTSRIKHDKKFEDLSKKFKVEFQDRCEPIRQFSKDAVSAVPDKIDFIFIDSSYEYKNILEDLKTWAPKVRSGGLIMGHNWSSKFPGVIKAVTDYLRKNRITCQPFQDYTRFELKYVHRPTPRSYPIINRSFPNGDVWWAIKR